MSQNLFKMFSNDPVEYNMKNLKAQLGMLLITQLRERGWDDASSAAVLQVDEKDVAQLLEGYLEDFTVDTLLTMLVRLGYSLDATYIPEAGERPFVLFIAPAS